MVGEPLDHELRDESGKRPEKGRPGEAEAASANSIHSVNVKYTLHIVKLNLLSLGRGLDLHIVMCENLHMPTNLALDDRLIEEARRAGKHKTKKEAVTAALDEYVRRRKQMKIIDVFGTVSFDPAYDYKAERRRSSRRASSESRT